MSSARTRRVPSLYAGKQSTRTASLRAWFTNEENLAFLLLAAVWIALLYGRALAAPFVYDDLESVVNNPSLQSWHAFATRFLHAPVAFTTNLRGGGGSTYRPLYWLALALDRRLWQLNPAGFHLTNLLLHLAVGCAGFRLLRSLRVALTPAALTVLIWLSLPINSEVVAWVSGRAYSLCTLFLCLSLLAALRYLRGGDITFLCLSIAAAFTAALSHELGLLALPLTLLLAFANTAAASARRRSLSLAALLSPCCYLALRRIVGGHLASGPSAVSTAALVFWKYLGWIILPVHLSVERSTSTPPPALSTAAVLAWAALLLAARASLAIRRRTPQAAAGLAWLALGLLPFCGVIFLYQGMAERFTYAASAGLVLATVALSTSLPRRLRPLAVTALAAWSLWGVWRLQTRLSDWRNPIALYQHSLEANPQSPSLTYNLAFSLRQLGDIKGAERYYLRTIDLRRDYPHAFTSLGDVYLQTNRLTAAERAYGIALEQAPDDLATILNLAVALQKDDQPAAAQWQYEQAIRIAPREPGPYSNLGVLLLQQGKQEEAAVMFTRAIERTSTDPNPYFNLAVLYQQQGRRDLALPLYRKVLELRPGDPDTLANLQKLNAPN